jgi:hypothetical protein
MFIKVNLSYHKTISKFIIKQNVPQQEASGLERLKHEGHLQEQHLELVGALVQVQHLAVQMLEAGYEHHLTLRRKTDWYELLYPAWLISICMMVTFISSFR